MKLKHFLIGACLSVCLAGSASAQVMIEMSEITCKQMAGYDSDTKGFIANWMRGYFHAKNNVSVVDLSDAKSYTGKVLAYCKKKPKVALMEAIEKNVK